MMFLGQYEFVYVLLTLNLPLATVHQFECVASAYRRAPRIRLLLVQTQFWIQAFYVADSQLVNVVTEVKVVDTTKIEKT